MDPPLADELDVLRSSLDSYLVLLFDERIQIKHKEKEYEGPQDSMGGPSTAMCAKIGVAEAK